MTVFVQVSVDVQAERRLQMLERAIAQRAEVLECYLMTGDADYLLTVVVPDVATHEQFLAESLMRVESIAHIKSSFALRPVKYSTALPLDGIRRIARVAPAVPPRGETAPDRRTLLEAQNSVKCVAESHPAPVVPITVNTRPPFTPIAPAI